MTKKLFVAIFVFLFFLVGLFSVVSAKESQLDLSQSLIRAVSGSLAITMADLAENVKNAEEVEAEIYTPRLLPGDRLYFVKIIWEQIRLFFTFDKLAKARYLVGLAEKRMAEAKALIEKGKSERAEKNLEKYEETLNQIMARTEEAREKGEDVEEIVTKVSEATLRHQKVLSGVWEKVPEPAQKVIEKAIEVSKKGCETALEAIKSPEKRAEILEKAKEVSEKVSKRLKEQIEKARGILEEGLEKFEETPPVEENLEPREEIKTLDVEMLEEEAEKILPTPKITD